MPGTPGFTSSAREHYQRMSQQMCDDQRTYFMGRCVEEPTFMRGECFIVEPFTDEHGWRMYRAIGQPIQMHG